MSRPNTAHQHGTVDSYPLWESPAALAREAIAAEQRRQVVPSHAFVTITTFATLAWVALWEGRRYPRPVNPNVEDALEPAEQACERYPYAHQYINEWVNANV